MFLVCYRTTNLLVLYLTLLSQCSVTKWYGKELIVIDRFYPSSKTCSRCGWKNKDLRLSDRTFVCKDCGLEIDRDLNAAINIQAVGVDAAIRTQSSRVTGCVDDIRDEIIELIEDMDSQIVVDTSVYKTHLP